MKKIIPAVAVAALFAATGAYAQTTAPSTSPSTSQTSPGVKSMPDATTPSATPSATPGSSTSGATTPGSSASAPADHSAAMTLTDEQAKSWINKAVYSSDGKNVGEVAALKRDASGKVQEMHADIGGFLGLGETRVRVMPSDFKVQGDRLVLDMTAEQAKSLPKIAK